MGYDACDSLPAAPAAATEPPPRAAARWRSRTTRRLSMPELDACGLSEAWLARCCGERHWQALAALLGRPPTAWADAQGRRVYAAFGALRWQAEPGARAHEGQRLQIASRAGALGRSRAWSQHRAATPDGPLGRLLLLSSFVSRDDGVHNRSVRRVELGGVDAAAPPAEVAALQADVRRWRASLGAPAAPALEAWCTTPCPRNDFNGAGLLYFASYGALADRALWRWGRLGVHDTVQRRDVLFLSNAELGEPVALRLLADEAAPDGSRRVALELCSAADGRRLAATCLCIVDRTRADRA